MSPTTDRIHVLHVDDEPGFADLAAEFLERMEDRIVVQTATSTQEGFEYLADSEVDCLVSDYDMPGLNGIEFLEAVREERPHLPFILFTGKGSEAVAGDAISAGVTDYLQKERGTEQYNILANRVVNAVESYRATQHIERQNDLFRKAQDIATVGAWEYDIETETVYNTAEVRRIHGLSPEAEMSLEKSLEYYHPDDRPSIKAAFQTAITEGEPYDLELRLVLDDGTERWVRTRGEPQFEDGDLRRVRGTIQDITDRKQRERDIEQNTDGERVAFLESLATHLSELSRDLLQTGQKPIEEQIDGALETIGSLVDADRSYVFEINQEAETLTNTHEWTADGVEPQIDSIQNLPFDALPWWMETLEDHETLLIQDVSELPPEAAAEKELLQAQNVTSLLVSPMISEDELVGFIGFDWVDKQDGWTANFVHILEISGEIISSSLQRESRRQELERREAYLEQSSDIISVMDVNGEVKYQSASTERVTEFSPVEVIGASGFEHVHPDDLEKFQEEFFSFVSHPEEEVQVELRVETKDGSWKWIEVRGVNKLNDPVIDGLLFSSRDITERKEREQEIRELTERLELAVEGANLGIWDWDMETDEVKRDDQLAEILGYPPAEIADHLDEWERLVHPAGKKRHDNALAEHVENRTPYYQCEYRLQTASGDWNWVRAIGKVVERDEDGNPVRAVGIHSDINDRKEREQELRREKERLDEFASVISHDLRNPLTVAQGRIELARAECDTDHLEDAASGVKRSLDLIEDLLALARGGQEVRDMEPVDMAKLVDASWNTVETADATVGVAIESTVRADRTRLRQLLENLFGNAVVHGGETVTVRVGSLPDGFYVEDNGSGIPDDKRQDVWEVGNSRNQDGTGFGLAISKQIVDAHGWDIRITESSTGGARFEITGVELVSE